MPEEQPSNSPARDATRRERRRRSSGRRAVIAAATLCACATGGILLAQAPADGAPVPALTSSTPTSTASPSPAPNSTNAATLAPPVSSTGAPTPAPTTSPAVPATAKEAATLAKDLDAALATATGHAAVTVADLDTGASASRGDTGHRFVTASIVKADILAALLLHHQDAGTTLSADQHALATRMIKQSDNEAASSLLAQLGGAAALDTANKRLGLQDTTAGTGGYWGLTTTTTADQLTLLQQIFGTGPSQLSTGSQTYLRSLMSDVAADQKWGISAAAGTGSGAALKNGWLPRSASGLWVINSIGQVERDGHTHLVAVLTDDNPTMTDGITLVERVADTASKHLAGPKA